MLHTTLIIKTLYRTGVSATCTPHLSLCCSWLSALHGTKSALRYLRSRMSR